MAKELKMATIIGGQSTYSLAATAGTPEDNLTVTFPSFTGSSALVGGNSNYTVIGDVQTMALSSQGGSPGTSELNFDTFNFGPVEINLGNGNDVVYGEVQTFNITSSGGSAIASGTTPVYGYSSMYGDNVNFGATSITLGTGTDTAYGAVGTFIISTVGGTASGSAAYASSYIGYAGSDVDNFTFAGNTISSALASVQANHLYGDIGTLTFSSASGSATNGGDAHTLLGYDTLTTGSNTLTAGNGADVLDGSIGTMNFQATGGTTNNAHYDMAEIFHNAYNIGGSSLTAGNGVDTLNGAIETMNITATGGNATGGMADAEIQTNSWTFGNNSLSAGNGKGDVLNGDVGAVNITIHGGAAGTGGEGGASFTNNTMTFGDNTLQVGTGNNDTLVGGVGSFTVSLVLGTSTGGDVSLSFESNTITFMGSTLTAGAGKDTLIGDMQSFSLTDPANPIGTNYVDNNVIYLGGNTLNAGSGNDTLYGSTPNLHMFDSFLNANSTNQVIGGFDTFHGGAGADTFVPGPGGNDMIGGTGPDTYLFDMTLAGTNAPNGNGINDGNTLLENFNAAKDILAFHGESSISALNAQTSVVDNAGTPEVIFNQNGGNGTIIDFYNLTYNTLEHTLLDVLNQNGISQHVIHLV
jgi:hypothetical protein